MIREMKRQHPDMSVQELCRSLGVSRQAHYRQAHRSERVLQGLTEVVELVRGIRATQPKLGGGKLYTILAPRIAALPVAFGRDRFFELLSREGLTLRKRKRRVRTTMSRHGLPVYRDLVKGRQVNAPGRVWVADITYWPVREGFYFIFLITDACSRKIIGHQVARGMSGEHALAALRIAQNNSPHDLNGIIHHSDRGKQYCFGQYVRQLMQAGMQVSMTESSDPRDNAVAERVNGILKNELLAHHKVHDIDQARQLLDDAVHIYNTQRPHLSCDLQYPEQAHRLDHGLNRRWKHRPYKGTVNLLQDEPGVVNSPQE